MLTPCGVWLPVKPWCGHVYNARICSVFFSVKHLGYILYIVICYYTNGKSRNRGCADDCCVRGYHVTEKHWKDIAICEGLTSCYEENNKYNPCAMAVYREHGPGNKRINVGHIPIELSSTLCFFVKHGGNIVSHTLNAIHLPHKKQTCRTRDTLTQAQPPFSV